MARGPCPKPVVDHRQHPKAQIRRLAWSLFCDTGESCFEPNRLAWCTVTGRGVISCPFIVPEAKSRHNDALIERIKRGPATPKPINLGLCHLGREMAASAGRAQGGAGSVVACCTNRSEGDYSLIVAAVICRLKRGFAANNDDV